MSAGHRKPIVEQLGRPRIRIAAATGATVLVGAGLLGLGQSAQASSQNFTVSSQIAPSFQGPAVPLGSKNFNLTVTPATAAPGASIEVELTSSDLSSEPGPASDLTAGVTEQVAVVAINGVDYALRGSAIGQNIPKYDGSDAAHGANIAPTMFDPGWVISSTPGGSSSTSTIDDADGPTWQYDSGTPANPADDVPAPTGTAPGSGGVGATIRGAEAVPVPLVAPATPGTYLITLKAVVVNSTTGSSTIGLADTFDQVINTAVQTNVSAGANNNGPKNTFNNNVASSYFTFTTPVELTVAADPVTSSPPVTTPPVTGTPTPTVTVTETVTATPTVTQTVTATPTVTTTQTVTASPTATPTVTQTVTATPTVTVTATPTVTITSAPTSTPTVTVTQTVVATTTATATVTALPTLTPTVTETVTESATADAEVGNDDGTDDAGSDDSSSDGSGGSDDTGDTGVEAASAGNEALASTGSDSRTLAVLAFLVLQLGVVLVVRARRQRPRAAHL